MSVVTFVIGYIGTSCPRDMFKGSFPLAMQSSQFKTNCSNCSLIPG